MLLCTLQYFWKKKSDFNVCHTNIPLIKDISKQMYMFIMYLYMYITKYWMYECIKICHNAWKSGPRATPLTWEVKWLEQSYDYTNSWV